MSRPDEAGHKAIVGRVVHRSALVDQPGTRPVIKLMLNLLPQGRRFEAGSDIGFMQPGCAADDIRHGLRRYSIESVGEVPFEQSIDVTVYVRDHGGNDETGTAHSLCNLAQGETVPVYGPFAYPFYPPMGSRSNMIIIGAGCGMVPFRRLAHKVQQRGLDWMGKVLMLEGPDTGLEHLYLNEPGVDQDQYFDSATQRAFEALKTRYSATALDRSENIAAHMEALWRLMGQGGVYVYRAGCRGVAAAMDEAMAKHLRLAGRWDEAKAALVSDGHWLEYLYD
jgi:sulfite reductase alpha subunit-like flavoprotein